MFDPEVSMDCGRNGEGHNDDCNEMPDSDCTDGTVANANGIVHSALIVPPLLPVSFVLSRQAFSFV